MRSFIDEARKFRVAITLSHQTLQQLDEENRTAAMGAANMVVFRVTGEDGKALAMNFDRTPTQVVVGDEPIRAPVGNCIGHLVNRGHNEQQVTKFAQGYLQRVDDFMAKKYERFPEDDNQYDAVYLTKSNLQSGREALNNCLYKVYG